MHWMKDRAQTPEQKREVIERIYAAWLAQPHLRLGQFIMNAVEDPYYVEDFALVKALERADITTVNSNIPPPPEVEKLIHWRASLIDAYGDRLVERVCFHLETRSPEPPPEHQEALEQFMALPASTRRQMVADILED